MGPRSAPGRDLAGTPWVLQLQAAQPKPGPYIFKGVLMNILARVSTLADRLWPVVRILAVGGALYLLSKSNDRLTQTVILANADRARSQRELSEARTYYTLAQETAGKIYKYHEATKAGKRPRRAPGRRIRGKAGP